MAGSSVRNGPRGALAECADARKHTKQPEGYLAWHEWAERKAKTHIQTRCPTCGLWAIWIRRVPAHPAEAPAQEEDR